MLMRYIHQNILLEISWDRPWNQDCNEIGVNFAIMITMITRKYNLFKWKVQVNLVMIAIFIAIVAIIAITITIINPLQISLVMTICNPNSKDNHKWLKEEPVQWICHIRPVDVVWLWWLFWHLWNWWDWLVVFLLKPSVSGTVNILVFRYVNLLVTTGTSDHDL